MTNPLTPMTKLDAVNGMLASIGQAPVNTLDVTGIRDVSIGELALDNVTREVLTIGWHFNTEEEYELVPDGNGKIALPSNTLDLDPCYDYLDFTIRDDDGTLTLYDRVEHTFDLSDYNPLLVNIVWAFEFDQIPQCARNYIATRAARIFQSQVIGSDILFKFTELHEREALATLKRLEGRRKDRNMLRSGADVNRIFTRHRNPLRYR